MLSVILSKFQFHIGDKPTIKALIKATELFMPLSDSQAGLSEHPARSAAVMATASVSRKMLFFIVLFNQ